MTISALIVGIAAFHYYYMRGAYVEDGIVSVHYRYMDWLITVPLMASSSQAWWGRVLSPTLRSQESEDSQTCVSSVQFG